MLIESKEVAASSIVPSPRNWKGCQERMREGSCSASREPMVAFALKADAAQLLIKKFKRWSVLFTSSDSDVCCWGIIHVSQPGTMTTRVGSNSRSQGRSGMSGVMRQHTLNSHGGDLSCDHVCARFPILSHSGPDVFRIFAMRKKLASAASSSIVIHIPRIAINSAPFENKVALFVTRIV
jgi:hypothetical protein